MTPCNCTCWQHNGIGRWQEAAEHEAERRLVRLNRDAVVSEVSAVCPEPHKDVRKSARWKKCNITAHCFCLRGVTCHSLYNLAHSELLYPLEAPTETRQCGIQEPDSIFYNHQDYLLVEVREGW